MIYRRGETVDLTARIGLPADAAEPSLVLRLYLVGGSPVDLKMQPVAGEQGLYRVRLGPDDLGAVAAGKYAVEIWLFGGGVQVCLGALSLTVDIGGYRGAVCAKF